MGFAPLRFAAALLLLLALPAAADDQAFAPHFGSLSRDKVSLRQGPGYNYKILWQYHRKGYPVRVTATYDAWRRIADSDGSIGWIHQTMVSDVRTVLVIGTGRVAAHLGVSPKSPSVALLDPGVVAKLKACQPQFCQIGIADTVGWIDRKRIWGVNPGEVFE
jgi:SH3-like domain-containing protein